MIRIIIACSNFVLAAGLRSLLETDTELVVIAEIPFLGELQNLSKKGDVLILTEEIPPFEDMIEAVRSKLKDTALLFLTDDPTVIPNLSELPIRAWGIISPQASPEELVVAVHALDKGLLVAAPELLEIYFSNEAALEDLEIEPLIEPLTERETQVLQLLAQGLSNKQIGSKLHISEHTVKFHVSSVYGKLGAGNRTEAVRLGVHQGLIVL